MKKLHIIPALLLLTSLLSAQTSAKKYVFLEHFTNSKCSVCASRNPTFYDLIGLPQYASEIHHIAVHPSVPYPTCIYYLANTTENSAWAALYGIQGTPQLALNGKLLPGGSQLLRQDTLNKYLNQTSPMYLKVTESGSGNTRSAKIEARALSQIPAGNYKLFVAVVEKTVNQAPPFLEAVHHDVFRDMLTPVTGQDFQVPAAGQSVEFTFDYTIAPAWVTNEVYVLAFIKEMTTKRILNSGTKFDPELVVNTSEPTATTIRLTPNPATDYTTAEIGDDTALRTEIYAANGKLVFSTQESQANAVSIATSLFARGVYYVKITGAKANYVAKLIRG